MVYKIEPAAEPPVTLTSPYDLLTGYLDFYRETVLRKLEGMSDAELRNSRIPTGWSPLGLFKHLACVELRWMQWGFKGEHIEEPWAEFKNRSGPWHVEPGETFADVKEFSSRSSARGPVPSSPRPDWRTRPPVSAERSRPTRTVPP
ncbi:DUF664 domain-containing protein [Streptomyces libani]